MWTGLLLPRRIAGLVIGLAVACIVAVTYIYQTTYKDPTDVTKTQAGGLPAQH